MREAIAGRYVGNSVRRVEDPRLLTGHGRFVDDVSFPGLLHATFVRSTHAHARVRSIEVDRARRAPGVVSVVTGAELAAVTNPLLGLLALPGWRDPTFHALSTDRVRHVGDPVAIVVAESRHQAEDAAELVTVDYEPLQPIATIGHALDPTRPPVWPVAKGNTLLESTHAYGDVNAGFTGADSIVTRRFTHHRVSNQPMETRAIVVEIRDGEPPVVHSNTQTTHVLKWALSLLTGHQTLRESAATLNRNRERITRFINGAKAAAAANPDMAGGGSPMMPVMLKQMVSDPKRTLALNQAMLALLAKDPGERPEVEARDIGGAFGSKGVVNREDVAVFAVAQQLGRSIKWVEDRNENLMGGGHARDEVVELSMAFSTDGTLRGMRAGLTMDTGAYPAFPFGAAMFAQIVRVMIPGPYRVPALAFDTRVLATNKATYLAYRGPWAVETWVRERLLDIAARDLGLSRAEIRLRNMYGPDELPAAMVTGPALDVRMSARRTLEDALAIADFDGWAAEQASARAQGRIRGLGFATFIEAAPGPPGFFDAVIPGMGAAAAGEPIHVVLEADGMVSILSQQVPHGQSHETTFAQVAADELGLPIEAVRFRYGDTRITPFGLMGTGGSRAGAMVGGVVTFAARELRSRVLDIAADLLEANVDDLVIEDGRIHVVGTPARSVDFAAVATRARTSPGAPAGGEAIRVSQEYTGGEGGWAQATHVCWVDIDLETGQVHIPRYLVVEDCGKLINPAVVDGQIRGGVAQGIGAVLYEKIGYTEEGQFQTGTYMDYLIPTVMEIPDIEIHHIETASEIEANYRGVGEGGMIAAPPALTNAIEDALAHLGVCITESYLPPSRILELAGVIPVTR